MFSAFEPDHEDPGVPLLKPLADCLAGLPIRETSPRLWDNGARNSD